MSSPSQDAMRREELALFEQAFDRLPADYQRVITMARLMGSSHAEIAAEMGRSEGAVRVLLHRALARLGVLVEEAGGGDRARAEEARLPRRRNAACCERRRARARASVRSIC